MALENPELSSFRKLLIFGGSFDPPHRAHVELPEQVRRALSADAIAYIPAAQSPHKLNREPTPASHRLEMLRAALRDKDQAMILTDELDRANAGEPSYTVETLERLHQRLAPAATLRLLIGADQVLSFERWHAPQRIVALAEPVVMVRPPETMDSLLEALPADQRAVWRDRLVEVTPMDISATEIRQRLVAGESIDSRVPPAVARYIEAHGLYADA